MEIVLGGEMVQAGVNTVPATNAPVISEQMTKNADCKTLKVLTPAEIIAKKIGSPRCLTKSDNGLECLRFLIPDRLAFASGSMSQLVSLKKYLECSNVQFFTSDLHERYDPFASDFGPVNLGIVHLFCKACTNKLAKANGTLIYCFDSSFQSQANASFLLAAFMMLYHNKSPQDAAEPFTCSTSPFTLRPFRDATHTPQIYPLSLEDCLGGLAKAVQQGWYNVDTFDFQEYQALDNPGAGDIHQICPKFIAFKGPLSENSHREHDELAFSASFYAPTFRQLGVTCVVRLNEATSYDKCDFEQEGIRHHDLYFDDCTIPSDDIVERFLDICDREARVAVHCRAGLGRTGTLIALWMMKHAGFTANEAMGWLRIVRPGSVIGPQQLYLRLCERRAWAGNAMVKVRALPAHPRHTSMPQLPSDLARQVTAGMCTRGLAKAAAAAAVTAAAVDCAPSEGTASLPAIFAEPKNSEVSAAAAAAMAAAVAARRASAPAHVSLPPLVQRPALPV